MKLVLENFRFMIGFFFFFYQLRSTIWHVYIYNDNYNIYCSSILFFQKAVKVQNWPFRGPTFFSLPNAHKIPLTTLLLSGIISIRYEEGMYCIHTSKKALVWRGVLGYITYLGVSTINLSFWLNWFFDMNNHWKRCSCSFMKQTPIFWN